jgi:hypothetical protein
MSHTHELSFKEIGKGLARLAVIEKHYLHRPCPISWAWGIFVDERLKGVLTIGKPPSWSTMCGVVGETYKEFKNNPKGRANDVYELNRLWVCDSMPRNTESRFIGYCLRELRKQLPNVIVVSDADTQQGHIGYVYQATNWIYTGTSAPFKDLHPVGYTDYRSVPNYVRGEKVNGKRAWALDPNVPRIERSIKHRYVWFGDKKDEGLLAWKRQPYPKRAQCIPNSLPVALLTAQLSSMAPCGSSHQA